ITRPTAAISYPYDNGYISQTGKITGGSYDEPNGMVKDVQVRVKQLTGPNAGKYWTVAGSSWAVAALENSVLAYGTLSPAATWWQLNTAPWQTGETYEINAWAQDKASNYQLVYATATNIKADFTAPTSTVTYPAHLQLVETELTVISGSASDAAPGALQSVRVSYQAFDGLYAGKWWDRAAGAWSSNSEILYDAAILGGNRWEATGASTPTWYTTLAGVKYDIFARAEDQAANAVVKPGLPAADSTYIRFTLKPPPPLSGITTPDTSVPNWKPSLPPSIIGTAVYSTTVQLLIVDYGPNLTEGTGNDDLAWNGGAWVSTNTFFDYVGVNTYNTPNWSWQIASEKWNVNRKYRVRSKASHTTNGSELAPGTGNEFIVDSTAPAAAITQPDKAYVIALTTITGNVSDTVPGTVNNAYFRVKRQGLAEYWNWQAATFTALSGQYTDLPASINAGVADYTTDYFKTGQAWEADKGYTVQLYLLDKAGNSGSAAEINFTIDRSSPTAVVVVPYDANKKGLRNLPSLSGTAADNRQNDDVRIAFQKWDGTNNLWYGFDGTSWDFNQSGAYWISMKLYGALSPDATWWSYAPAGLDGKFTPGTSGFRYIILSRASDLAGNTQAVFTTDVSSVIITMDKAAPSSAVTLPADDLDGASGRYNSSRIGKDATNTRFYGTSADGAYTQYNAGVSASQIRLTYLSGGDTYYWDQANLNFSSWTVTAAAAWAGALVGGAGPWTWTFLTDISWPAVDREYKLEARAMDDSRLSNDTGDGNWEDPQTRGTNIKYFLVDDSPPSVLITFPTANAVKTLAQLSGTASADIAGHKQTEVRISTTGVDGTKYWTGTGWAAADTTWIITTKEGPTSWYYMVDAPMLKDDVRYQFEARVKDYADNYSAVYSTYSVTYDITGPLVTLSYPANGATYSGVLFSTPMAGTSANNQSAAYTGVSTVAVALSEIGAEPGNSYLNCFNGSVFSGCTAPLWLPAQGAAANWGFNDPDIVFISDKRYKYEARSADLAGNYSAVSNAITKFDLDKPTSTVLSPSAEYVNSIPVISGQASDERYGAREYEAQLGTYTVRTAIKLVGGNWWNNSASAFNSASPLWYETGVNTAPYTLGQATVTWSYSLPAGLQSAISTNKRQDYRFVTYAYDQALNKEYGPASAEPGNADIPAEAGRIVQFDNEIPVAVATTPANLSYKYSVPALYGVVTDTGVVTAVQVLVKARGTSYNSTWKGTYLNASGDWDDTTGKYANWSTATYNNGAWSLALPSLTPVNNAKISVWARGADKAGNWQASPSNVQVDNNQNPDGSAAYYFTFDESRPLTGVTAPGTYAVAVAT
ncbi:MAG: Ig-like domain repeat protein, partial [Elusimicrobiota bacterium]|nr:Ig-like domain repeat protein [Elusimicrobiota bacterium]